MRTLFLALLSFLPIVAFAQATPVVVADICPGGCSSNPTNLVEWNGKVYFFATSPTAGRELHVYDGTSVSVVADIAAGSGNGIAPYGVLTLFGNKLYFGANDTTGATRFYMYSYDGISSPQKIVLGNSNSIRTSGETAAAGSDLVLGYNDSANRYQLAKYQPGTNNLQLITTGSPDAFGSFPANIICTNGHAYCVAFKYQNGLSASFASFIINLSTGAVLSLTTSVIASPKLLNDEVYFPYFDPTNQYGGGHHIFRYRFSNFSGGLLSQGPSSIPIAASPGITVGVYNNNIYYQGLTTAGNFSSSSLFRYDPSSNIATPVAALPNTAAGGFLLGKTVSGVLYISHQTNSAGQELYGFTGGTTIIQITDIDGPSAGFNPTSIISYNGNLLITGTTSANGTELYHLTGNGLGLTAAQNMSGASLSPNPVSSELTVALPTTAQHTLRIISATGQTLRTHTLQGPLATVAVQDLPIGMYFVHITDATGAQIGHARFVKE